MTANDRHTDTQDHPERTLVLNVDLSRGLVAALLVLAAVVVAALLLRGPAPASAAGEQLSAATDGMRRYYLAGAVQVATDAPDGCEAGYHFASLWEILDTSNLVYNTALGVVPSGGDSGSGPITGWEGWVRTGYTSSNVNTPGQANCSAWQLTTGFGTTVSLPSDWISGGDIHVWDAGTATCGLPANVWCVED
jgi:hypothetical protein